MRLSAPCAGRPLPPGIFLVLISVRGWFDPQGHSAAGRIRSVEKSSELIGNRTCDLLACSIVPQPTMLPHAPIISTAFLFYRTPVWVLVEWLNMLLHANAKWYHKIGYDRFLWHLLQFTIHDHSSIWHFVTQAAEKVLNKLRRHNSLWCVFYKSLPNFPLK
jgi:hypothetical protein